MSNALFVAVNGINNSVARATQAASNIVNASSMGKNIDSSLVTLSSEKTNIAADAAIVKTVQKDNKALLDITA